jgi:hypothetical protein
MRKRNYYGMAYCAFDQKPQKAGTRLDCESKNTTSLMLSSYGCSVAYQAVVNAIKSDTYAILDPILEQRLSSDYRLFRLLKSCAMVGCDSPSCVFEENILQISIVVGKFIYRFFWKMVLGRVSLETIHIIKDGLSMALSSPHRTVSDQYIDAKAA